VNFNRKLQTFRRKISSHTLKMEPESYLENLVFCRHVSRRHIPEYKDIKNRPVKTSSLTSLGCLIVTKFATQIFISNIKLQCTTIKRPVLIWK